MPPATTSRSPRLASGHIDDDRDAAREAELVGARAFLAPARQVVSLLEYFDAAVAGVDHERAVGGFIDGKVSGPQQEPAAAVLMRFGIAADNAAGRGALWIVVHDESGGLPIASA